MITFATTNLTPDTQAIIAWLVSEGLAWFLSLPANLAVTTIALGCFVLLAALFLLAEQVLTWAVKQ